MNKSIRNLIFDDLTTRKYLFSTVLIITASMVIPSIIKDNIRSKISSSGLYFINLNFPAFFLFVGLYLVPFALLILITQKSKISTILFIASSVASLIFSIIVETQGLWTGVTILFFLVILFSLSQYLLIRPLMNEFIGQILSIVSPDNNMGRLSKPILNAIDAGVIFSLITAEVFAYYNQAYYFDIVTYGFYITVLPLLFGILYTLYDTFNQYFDRITSKREKITAPMKSDKMMEIPELQQSLEQADEIPVSEYMQREILPRCEYRGKEVHNDCYGKVTYICHHCSAVLCEEHAYVFIDKEFPRIRRIDSHIISKGVPPNQFRIYLATGIFVIAIGWIVLDTFNSSSFSEMITIIIGNLLAIIALIIGYSALGEARIESSFQRTLKSKYGDDLDKQEGIELQGFFYASHCWDCVKTGHPKLFENIVGVAKEANDSNIKIIRKNSLKIADAFVKGLFSSGKNKYYNEIRIGNWYHMKSMNDKRQQLEGIYYGFDAWTAPNGEEVSPAVWVNPKEFYDLQPVYKVPVTQLILSGFLSVMVLLLIIPLIYIADNVPRNDGFLIILGILNGLAILIAAFISLKFLFSYNQIAIIDRVLNPEQNLIEMTRKQRELIHHVENCISCRNEIQNELYANDVWRVKTGHLNQ